MYSKEVDFVPKQKIRVLCLSFLLGGSRGYSDVLYKVESYQKEGPSPTITFSYHSVDGEEGNP